MGRHKERRPFVDEQLKPPSTLAPRAKEIFQHIVDAVDDFHFSAVDLPLLVQYCGVCELAEKAQLELDTDGAVVNGKVSAWLAVIEKTSRAAVALSARLRLCPQSRFDRTTAGVNSRSQPKRLWEGDHDEDDPEGLLAKEPRSLASFRKPMPSADDEDDDRLLA